MLLKDMVGKVLTARGPVEPSSLGRVMMHEHLHADLYDWDRDGLVTEEQPLSDERRRFLLSDAVPLLKECVGEGLGAYVDTTMPPWRGWPDIYCEVSEAAGVHIITCTGFYREIEAGTYFVKSPDDAIWPFVRESSEEALAEMCTREIAEGVHGTDIRAGAIKLGTSQAPMTPTETKAFRAGARAQLATGVHITTHCTRLGAETSQLTVLDAAGVDLRRVVIGHTASHLMDKGYRATIMEWMKRGANFLPTNLGIGDDGGAGWQPLIDAVHEVFDAGHGDKLFFGLDHGYCSESGPFNRVDFLPPPPFAYMFRDVLPAFRRLGLSVEEETAIMVENPCRVLPVQ